MSNKTHLTSFVLLSFLLSACVKEDPAQLEGAATYKEVCKACHASGINGAPILGNPKMWGPRVEQGVEVLIEHAINGYELMPAKGGKTSLSDEQVANTVRYMMSELPK